VNSHFHFCSNDRSFQKSGQTQGLTAFVRGFGYDEDFDSVCLYLLQALRFNYEINVNAACLRDLFLKLFWAVTD